MVERMLGTRDFWLQTCKLDTHRRGSGYARHDTPWNAFAPDGRLVCTLWQDFIVEVHDKAVDGVRRFVRLGGETKLWKGPAVKHGNQARENLWQAIQEKRPIFGFVAEPDAGALRRGERSVKHFFADRVFRLEPRFGATGYDLEQRLKLDAAFKERGVPDVVAGKQQAWLFELIPADADVPGRIDADEASAAQPIAIERADEADEVGQAWEGNLSNEECARFSLPILVGHVLRQQDDVLQPMTYLDLARAIGRRNKHGESWARGMGRVLDAVTALVDSVADQLPERPPFLAGIVVLSSGPDAGLPDKGVDDVWPGYLALTRQEKRDKMRLENDRVLRYGSRWNDVLDLLGMPPVPPQADMQSQVGGWAGGESAAHKALKRYIHDHPTLVGATTDFIAHEEFALRSGDALDVMFKSERIWIGVEVKSRVSDRLPTDYERGLYQAVKYRAVLEAQARIDHQSAPPRVRVLLVLECSLPAEYRKLAEALGAEVLERVMPVPAA